VSIYLKIWHPQYAIVGIQWRWEWYYATFCEISVRNFEVAI